MHAVAGFESTSDVPAGHWKVEQAPYDFGGAYCPAEQATQVVAALESSSEVPAAH